MSSDVVLTAALRSNLLSLQNTQRLIDSTQLRLATGLKVNSALDNPQNFFSAQSLNNRAGDLSRLLDGISQSIRTVEEANSGVTALTSLVEQADSIVQSARDVLAASEGEARALGITDLSDLTDLPTDLANITAGAQFDITTVGDDGLSITETITINAGDTAESLAAQINNAFADNQDGEITAQVTTDGFLDIASVDGRSFRIEDNTAVQATTLAGFQDLGLGDYFADEVDGAGNTVASATIIAGNSITSRGIYEANGDLIEAGDLITGTYQDVDGATIVDGLAAADTIDISVNGGTAVTFTVSATTSFQDLIDTINSDTSINTLVEASFDQQNGQITIEAISGETDNIALTVNAAGASTFNIGFGDESANFDPLGAIGAGNPQSRIYAFSTSISELEDLAVDYNEVRNQIDRIVVDANYRGVNLLNGDDLTTFFNEDRSSSLVTEGVNFTSNGLGLGETNFSSAGVVDATADQVRSALESIRAFGTTLSNDLSIIQTRRDFTESTINTLQAGADDLVVADQNEEGANLLALQTRQQLGVTSLSLAAQSQQSVLALF